MIHVLPLVVAVFLGVTCWWVGRIEDGAQARRTSVVASSVVVALLLAALLADSALPLIALGDRLLPHGMLRTAPFVVGIVTLVATALAPLATHPPRTLARSLLLSAHAQASLGLVHPVVLVSLWGWSAWTVARELWASSRDPAVPGLFALYHGASVLMLAAGVGFAGNGPLPAISVGAILMAIGIREAALPGHSWFPRFVQSAPMAIVVTFAGPQLGVFLQLELIDATSMARASEFVAIVGGTTALVAAMLAVVQIHARRGIAYLIMSQTGLIAFGLASNSTIGLMGAVLNWQVLAVATSGLAMILAALEARRGPLRVDVPNGSFARTPRLATAFVVLGLGSVGFPLTLGFVAEDLLLQGTISAHPTIGVALVVATAFNGVTVVRMFFCLFAGSSRLADGERDLATRERWVVAIVVLVLLGLGIVPRAAVIRGGRIGRMASPTDHQRSAPAPGHVTFR